MTRLAGRALDLVVDVIGAHVDVAGSLADRAAVILEDGAELLRFLAAATRAAP
jgi:hypothetical protein